MNGKSDSWQFWNLPDDWITTNFYGSLYAASEPELASSFFKAPGPLQEAKYWFSIGIADVEPEHA